jgi:hypothetical protein
MVLASNVGFGKGARRPTGAGTHRRPSQSATRLLGAGGRLGWRRIALLAVASRQGEAVGGLLEDQRNLRPGTAGTDLALFGVTADLALFGAAAGNGGL